MMELTIVCPLCSQPGFSDVNSLWLNLIRASSRQLACPVCHEVLIGLDKLTIHLVGHSIQYQASDNSPSSSISSLPAVRAEGLDIHGGSDVPIMSLHSQPCQSSFNGIKASTPVSSFVLFNFSAVQGGSVDESGELQISDKVCSNSDREEHFRSSSTCPFETSNKSESSVPLASSSSVAVSPTLVSALDCLPHSIPSSKNLSTDTSSQVKIEEVSSLLEGSNLYSPPRKAPNIRNREESADTSQTSPLLGCLELESGVGSSINNSISEISDQMVSCVECGLTFKDNNIAILHQQLVHNQNSSELRQYQDLPKIDEVAPNIKRSPTRSKRGSIASQSRDAASPLHRFPCIICNKVFRMRGSLMVHLRVAHSPSGAGGLATRLAGSSSSSVSQLGYDSCKLSLQNLSIEESGVSPGSGVELGCLGHAEATIKDQMLFDEKVNEGPVSPSNTTESFRSMAISSRAKANKSGLSKTPATTFSTTSPNHSPVVQASHIDCYGLVFPCTLCNKTFSKDSLLSQHLKSHDSKQWECDVCSKAFTTKYFLKKHKRLHTGEMPYTCGICNKSFTFQQSYHKHLLYHSDEKPHACTECGRAFKELSTLHNHQRIHTGEKPWACETCDVGVVFALTNNNKRIPRKNGMFCNEIMSTV